MVTYLSHNSKESTNPTESVSFEGTYCSVLCSILMQLLGDPPKNVVSFEWSSGEKKTLHLFSRLP